MKRYDIIIIGSGSGAQLIRPCANLGLKVAILEKDKIGGTCLNHGCIPSKMLIHPADVATEIESAEKFDLYVNTHYPIGFEKLVKRVNNTIDVESEKYVPIYEKHLNIDYYTHPAKFLSDKVLLVNGEKITAEKIFLPIGTRPHIPNIKGLKEAPFMTYIEALRNTNLPKKLLILGGGYVAAELGYFYAMMGSEVHFLVRSSMLRKEDGDIHKEFNRVFSKQFSVHYGARVEEALYENQKFILKGTQTFEGDALLVATGVTPNTDKIGIENTGIKLDQKGYIEVDDSLRTSVEGIWAYGDVIGRKQFRHTANFEGQYLFRTLFDHPSKEPLKYSPIPHAIFTHPQIGSVGSTEEELQSKGIEYFKGLADYKDCAMGSALLSENGFVKLLFEKKSKELVGAHIIGEDAATLIHIPIAYMNMGGTLDDMLRTIYIHPALPEAVRNAARNAG